MPTIRIDNQEVTVAEGATVLSAARAVGLDIPALCFHEGCTPQTSCMCCVVRVNGGKRLVPSCATVASEGMIVESETDEIHAARKMALELLLADHAGDCRAPCQTVCPAKMDIPEMIRLINAGQLHEALLIVKEHIALPAVLGRICPEICEKGCRRTKVDGAVSICRLKRYVADVDLESQKPWLPPCQAASGKKVAIVGTGPAGLAAAWYLLQLGHACTLYDEHDEPGGNLRYAIDPEKLPRDVLDAEIELVRKLGAKFVMKTRVGADISIALLKGEHDAVLLAVGEVTPEKARALGIPIAGRGLKIDKVTMLTPMDWVFAAGAAVTPYHHAVRACGDGRTAALLIDQHLRGALPRRESNFNVRLGVLSEAEMAIFVAAGTAEARAAVEAAGDGLSAQQALCESGRCLHCDCAKLDGCALRRYSMAYNADASAYKLERREFTRTLTHPLVTFEEGKCIQCGLCVQIATRAQEPLGLTYIGRGFQVRIGVPFSREMSAALEKVAIEAAEACPTSALSLRKGEGEAGRCGACGAGERGSF